MPEPRIRETLRMPENADRDTAGSAGGDLTLYKAQAAGLKIGDVVAVSSTIDDSITTTTTAADASKYVGVVVGGGSTGGYDRGFFGSESVGLAVLPQRGSTGAVGMTVVVATSGIMWVTADGPIARGANIGFSTTTAGRVTSTAVAANMIGTALRAAAGAGSIFPMSSY